jgi:hypothetical protein
MLLQRLEVVERDAEGRHDHHVVRGDAGEVEAAVVVGIDEVDPHVPHPLVHVGIVDDLAHQVDLPVRELHGGLVGVVHRPVHAVAEAELLGQLHGDVAEGGACALAALIWATTALWYSASRTG